MHERQDDPGHDEKRQRDPNALVCNHQRPLDPLPLAPQLLLLPGQLRLFRLPCLGRLVDGIERF